MGHRLGIARADTCDALTAILWKDDERAAPLLRRGVDALEAVPWVFDASPSTHLSNIFVRLVVGLRGELGDVARREGIHSS
jgi:hypothetical protein